eukprot:360367-Chlamydomonas_euryale.AAC.3
MPLTCMCVRWRLSAAQPEQPEAPSAAPPVAAAVAAAAQKMGAMGVEDDDADEDDTDNPYVNASYHAGEEEEEGYDNEGGEDAGDEDGDEEGDEEGYDEEGDEYYDDEYEDGEEGEEGWEPSVAREQHMKGALMIQKAACLEMIGQDAYDQLYELLKSNQVDEASMTDLSRLVFKIIPYDKSEVIQMMYKLLYLESQLESPTGVQ